jgi:hypothetical protein
VLLCIFLGPSICHIVIQMEKIALQIVRFCLIHVKIYCLHHNTCIYILFNIFQWAN